MRSVLGAVGGCKEWVGRGGVFGNWVGVKNWGSGEEGRWGVCRDFPLGGVVGKKT